MNLKTITAAILACRGTKRSYRGIKVVLAILMLLFVQARAADFHIDWLDMSNNWMTGSPVAVPLNGNVPSGSVFKFFGSGYYGSVTIIYTFQFNNSQDRIRDQLAAVQNKAMVSGPHMYSWNTFDALFRFNDANPGTLPSSYEVKYTFTPPMPAGELVLGVQGLGREAEYNSTITVNNAGTFLGDYNIPLNTSTGVDYGPTLFMPGPSFALQNSVPPIPPLPGSPHFNTDLGVVSIDDYPVNELTLQIYHIGFDGFEFTVGRRHALEENPDAWIQDKDPCDNGTLPNLCPTNTPMWESDDIRARNTQTTDPWQLSLPHQNPIAGVPNWVYVKLRNRGNIAVTGSICLYWTPLSMATRWDNNNLLPVAGYEFDWPQTATVGPYSPFLTEAVVEFEWIPPDIPKSGFCLFARFISSADPMNALEVNNSMIADNARNNNNIAMKNVFHVGPPGPIDIHTANSKPVSAIMDVELNAAGGGSGIPFLDGGSVRVVLSPEMFNNWMGAGGQGQGIMVNPNDSSISLTSPLAKIQGIPMGAYEDQLVTMYFSPDNGSPTPAFQRFVVSQFSDGQTTPDGGVTFEFGFGAGGTIPTLTEWGLIIFGVLLVGFMTWVFLKRRKSATIEI